MRTTERPRLRQGVRVLRRGPAEVQVGLDPGHAVVLPDSEPVRRTLQVLTSHGPMAVADPDVLDRLSGLVEEPVPRCRVDLREFGPVPVPLARTLAADAGLAVVDPVREDADVGLLVGAGEPERDLLDPWLSEGLPHLLVRVSEGVAVVGPFVAAGRGACLRCLDAHHTDHDPRWPLLVEQTAGLPGPDPPAALLALALGWAVAEIAGYVAGRRPATWSATLRIPPDLGATELVGWRPHPACGCGWNHPVGRTDDQSWARMEA